MTRLRAVTHQFVDFMPEELEEGVVYVSIEYTTVAHKCCCGCGNDVITPLAPTDWQLTFDGRTISLRPSIGNWNFPCQSHYWIERDHVRWAAKMSRQQIDAGRARDQQAKQEFYGQAPSEFDASPDAQGSPGKLHRFFGWLLRR